jgi:hypothetical protein
MPVVHTIPHTQLEVRIFFSSGSMVRLIYLVNGPVPPKPTKMMTHPQSAIMAEY